MELRPQEWFQTIQQEYLQRFVGQGGSSVKFVVTPTEMDRAQVQDQLVDLAEKEHFACVRVDAKDTKIHMMDKFFSPSRSTNTVGCVGFTIRPTASSRKWVSDS